MTTADAVAIAWKMADYARNEFMDLAGNDQSDDGLVQKSYEAAAVFAELAKREAARAKVVSESATITSEPYDGPRTISELPDTFPVADSNLDIPVGTVVTMVGVTTGDEARMVGAQHLRAAWQPRVIGSTLQPEPGRFADTPLTAAEVTESGWYWWRVDAESQWEVAQVVRDADGLWVAGWSSEYIALPTVLGTFIGPLRAPAT